MADVGGHVLDCPLAADGQKRFISSCVELQNRRSKLESLCPLGPTPRSIAPLNRKHRGSAGGFPSLLELKNLLSGEFKELVDLRFQARRSECWIDLYHQFLSGLKGEIIKWGRASTAGRFWASLYGGSVGEISSKLGRETKHPPRSPNEGISPVLF